MLYICNRFLEHVFILIQLDLFLSFLTQKCFFRCFFWLASYAGYWLATNSCKRCKRMECAQNNILCSQYLHKIQANAANFYKLVGFHIKCIFHLFTVNTTIWPVHFVYIGRNEKNAANRAYGTNAGNFYFFHSLVRALFAE